MKYSAGCARALPEGLQFAECCLKLYEITDKEIYKTAVEQWFQHVSNQLENRKNYTLYAENYARVIHFLFRFGEHFDDEKSINQAQILADEAIENLFIPEKQMFRSHTKEMRYDAVDGIGFLYFPLNWMETQNYPEQGNPFF